jgi:AraC-like DNA-binding protein
MIADAWDASVLIDVWPKTGDGVAMMRPPVPALRPFVALVWASDDPVLETDRQPVHEHVLPTGMMHLVFRLNDSALRVGHAIARPLQSVDSALIGGVRSKYYVRELSAPSCSVGAVLRPGVSELLFGATADEFAERHTSLEEVWNTAATRVRERLLESPKAEDRLSALESMLAARLPCQRSLHPAIASVIDEFHCVQSVDAAVQRSGLSHRQFISNFRRAVGLAPKTYLRVLRFQSALRVLRRHQAVSLAALAVDAGYSDQAHFNRDFIEFTGVTPMTYRRLRPCEPNHLRLEAPARPG